MQNVLYLVKRLRDIIKQKLLFKKNWWELQLFHFKERYNSSFNGLKMYTLKVLLGEFVECSLRKSEVCNGST